MEREVKHRRIIKRRRILRSVTLAPINKKPAGSSVKPGTGSIGKPSAQIGKTSGFGSSSKATSFSTPGKLSGSEKTASFFGASTKDSYFGSSSKDSSFGSSPKSSVPTIGFGASNTKSSNVFGASAKTSNVKDNSVKLTSTIGSPPKSYSASPPAAKPDSYSSSNKPTSVLGSTYSSALGPSVKNDNKSSFGKSESVLGSTVKNTNTFGSNVKYESKPTYGGKTENTLKSNSVLGSTGKSSNALSSPVKNENKTAFSGKTESSIPSSVSNNTAFGSSGSNPNSSVKKAGMLSSTGVAATVLLSSGTNNKSLGYTSPYTNAGPSVKKETLTPSGNANKLLATGPNSNLLGSNAKHNAFSNPIRNDGAFGSTTKPSNIAYSMSTGKNNNGPKYEEKLVKPLTSTAKSSNVHVANKSYPSFINPKEKKATTRFGLIWLPLRKRNKKKDGVYSSHNYQNYDRAPSMYNYMSGDSPDYQPPKKKEEETLLVPERAKLTSVAVNTGITAASIDMPPDGSGPANPEEKQEFIRRESEESKEAAGDTNESKIDKDYLENNDNFENKSSEKKWDTDKQGDKVDSVYLRPPPPHKARSTTSTTEEEDCGIKCLYYTLQCCDCVLM